MAVLKSSFFIASFVCVFFTSPVLASETRPQVNVYSYRQPFLVAPLFETFTAQTGIEVKTIFAKKGLIERVKTEGKRSPADVILTTDIGRLQAAREVSQAVSSPLLKQHIPALARGADDKWFGLTWRARVIYASKARVRARHLRFEDLTEAQWRGRICLRSGQHPYNVALFAALLDEMGEAKFRQWLLGLKANLAAKPSGNDRAQVRRVYGGACDLAIGNTYYMGKMQTNEKKPEQKQWADSVKIIFPDMPRGGAHMNVSGMAMAKHAPNRANALKLMEFLVSEAAQETYATVNFEYPIRDDVAVSPRVKTWGAFTRATTSLDRIAALRVRASQLVDETGFNAGP
ncbi:MAG: extracellular solute-binding protein [Rhodobiaceae bacterium]|jgi:iron(III) transport system substrate-binding protein|nr:extracellular solute-binding protein [Rhodobiaceae bacterium]MBT7279942.1 extracellular solute-binding protein [Rhodobiaceae bacterium]MDG2496089.1 extracellular solute-binding protein [Alphaproteobacteria bacterium]